MRAASQPIRKGDVLFYLADEDAGNWVKTKTAHVGLAARDHPGRDISSMQVLVYHMTLTQVERDYWKCRDAGSCCYINLFGSCEDLGGPRRSKIIDTAAKTHNSKPSIIKDNLSRYYFGNPSRKTHPLYDRAEGMYAFTCATFVHDCYKEAKKPLINFANIEFISDEERRKFEAMLTRHIGPGHVQQTPFKRLNPSYLAHAFRLARYPLNLADWSGYRDHGFFVPLPIVSDEPPA